MGGGGAHVALCCHDDTALRTCVAHMFHTYKYDRSPPTPPSSTNPISRQDFGQNWSQQLVSFKIKISRRQLLFLSKSRLKAQKLAGAVERTGPDQRVRMLASSRFVLTAHLRSWRSFKGLKMFGSRGLLSETDEPEKKKPPWDIITRHPPL